MRRNLQYCSTPDCKRQYAVNQMAGDEIFNFHGLARALAEQNFTTVHERWQASLSCLGPFPFFQLPVEIATAILKMASTKSSTYATLMRTSRALADLARIECVPDMVVIADRQSAISFYACVSARPEVGHGVKQMWFFPAMPSKQAKELGSVILKACCNIQRLACFPDILIGLMNSAFIHHSLVDVTLMDPIIPWQRLIGSRHGSRLFAQLKVLRLVGGSHPAMPPHGTSFPNLTDFTLVANNTACVSPILLNHAGFPNLTSMVVTVPYLEWRVPGMGFLMTNPQLLMDTRLVVVHCSKKWKELETWKEGVSEIWNMGVTEWNSESRNAGSLRQWR